MWRCTALTYLLKIQVFECIFIIFCKLNIVLRKLESHRRLVLVHGVRRRLQIDTDPPRLRSIDKSEYAQYVKYAKYDLISVGPCTLPAQRRRHTRTAQILSTRSVNMIRYLLRSGTVKSPVTSR